MAPSFASPRHHSLLCPLPTRAPAAPTEKCIPAGKGCRHVWTPRSPTQEQTGAQCVPLPHLLPPPPPRCWQGREGADPSSWQDEGRGHHQQPPVPPSPSCGAVNLRNDRVGNRSTKLVGWSESKTGSLRAEKGGTGFQNRISQKQTGCSACCSAPPPRKDVGRVAVGDRL